MLTTERLKDMVEGTWPESGFYDTIKEMARVLLAKDVDENRHDESNSPEFPESCLVVPLVPKKEMRLQIHPFAETTCMNCGSNVIVDCVENALLSWEDMLAAAPNLDGC
ncbi:MAG: hypothetical protein G5701_08940 [Serratia symbiotica]|nr:hypothetical protein [Serratia symbiotica]